MGEGGPLRRVVVATANAGKLVEIRAILSELPLVVVPLPDASAVRFPDEGPDYRANAIAKARAVAEQLGEVALGDDSGLEVAALGGAPGPLSARYGGPGLDDRARWRRLLDALADTPADERAAVFVCVAALVTPEGRVEVAEGRCAGRILEAARGEGGFGYDPVFQPEGDWGGRSMAELSEPEKNRISHRGRALGALREAMLEAAKRPAG